MPVCPLSPGVLRSFSRMDGRLLALAPRFVGGRQPHGSSSDMARMSHDPPSVHHSTSAGLGSQLNSALPIRLSLARGPSCTYTLTFLVTTSSPGEPCVRSRPLMQLPLFPLLNHNRSVGIQGTDSTYNSAPSRKHIRWSVCFRI